MIDLFTQMGRVSRLWLPPLLQNVANLVPGLCDADGCSIFLVSKGKLQLAATTRQYMKPQLFHPDTSYTIDHARLKHAAEDYKQKRSLSRDAGLTGWVGGFNRPLRLDDITDDAEREAIARSFDLPMPVWSDRLRGYFDFEGNRPFLAVPMRHAADDTKRPACGVIRVYSVRKYARKFEEKHVDALLAFGAALASFIADQGFAEGLDEFFRLWSAHDGRELVRSLTEAIPRLWSMDCCSYFERDKENRFVLTHCAASTSLSRPDREHFDLFARNNLGRLYYDRSTESKTGLAIERQEALLLHRAADQDGSWKVLNNPDAQSKASSHLKEESSAKYIGGSSLASCELSPHSSRSLLLVPIRDAANPRMLAGLLRVVSTQGDPKHAEKVFGELRQFAAPLAERLGRSVREELERSVCMQLIEQLKSVRGDDEGAMWHAAAEIVARALNADAVTIFRTDQGTLRSSPQYTYLNEEQIRREQPMNRLNDLRARHNGFQQELGAISYGFGQGYTGWVAQHQRVLNVRKLGDEVEMKQLKIDRTTHHNCEITEPGPFIAAPLALGPLGTVEGVVRAVRWQASAQGSFTASHELTLSTFAMLLASVSRVWVRPRESGERSVVVSYSDAHLKDLLCRLLTAVGIKPLHLGQTPGGTTPNEEFLMLMRGAVGGIAIATPDKSGRLSDNVVYELGEFGIHFSRERVLVLASEGLRLPVMANPVAPEVFKSTDEFSKTFITVASAVRGWY